MRRLLPLAAAAALVVLVFLLPQPSDVRLAALQCHSLLEAPAPLPGDVEGEEVPTLGERVLDGAAVTKNEDGTARLVLYGAGLTAPGKGEVDLAIAGDVRRSIVRGLRSAAGDGVSLEVVGEEAPTTEPGGASFRVEYEGDELRLVYWIDGAPQDAITVAEPFAPASRFSLLPPLIAIALAVLFRKPLPALFAGVVAGAFLLRSQAGFNPALALPLGTRDVFTDFLWPEVVDPARYMIILFVVFMLAMVGVITHNGGVRGLMDAISRLASSAKRTQFATYLMGLVVFFDDYANTILVGSTMRPISDRWRVSREKLAYIIDSTAAPVAGLAVFSTWIAFEVSTFSAQLPAAGLTAGDGYAVFLQTLPYRFYCILTLVFVGMVAFTGRDFGPMRRAETRARVEGRLVRAGGQPLIGEDAVDLEPAPSVTPRALYALAPVLTFILVTLFEIAHAGGAFEMTAGEFFSLEGATKVLYDGSGSQPLMVASFAGLVLAMAFSLRAGLPGVDVLRAAWKVLAAMGIAILILYHAWMIGAVCGELGTAPYLTALVGDSLDPLFLPAILFVLAGLVAFATGSSWSTMSILLPLVVVLAYQLGTTTELAESAVLSGRLLMVMSIGAVLEGAIFGDHCSPISVTTVMSSIAAASDHIDHVRTQAPYAIVTMTVAMIVGYLPCALLGLSPFLGLLLGVGVLAALVFLKGRRPD